MRILRTVHIHACVQNPLAKPLVKPKLALALGTFDGLHLGHRQLIDQVLAQGKRPGWASAVLCFEPYPIEFVAPDKAPPRIANFRDTMQRLASWGVDYVVCLKFDQAFQQQSARSFITNTLVRALNVGSLSVGSDFRFGRDRQGCVELLQSRADEFGYQLHVPDTYEVAGQRVSSTRIRQALQSGDFTEAKACLGRHYNLSARVVRGQQIGRSIGFATANCHLKHPIILRGVLVAQLVVDGQVYPAVANAGVKPSVGGKYLSLEVHAIDVHLDIYDKQVTVVFLQKIRDEKKFASLDALKQQLTQDVQYARQYFERHKDTA